MPRKADERLEGRIVDAAYQIWSEGGENALTMRAVAKAARTTTPTLYERFANKHELLDFLRARARERMFQAVKGAKTAIEACELGLKFTLANRNEYALLISDWATRLRRKEKERLPSFEFLQSKLAEHLGGLPEDQRGLALTLVALLQGTATLAASEGVDAGLMGELEKACLGGFRKLIGDKRDRASDQMPSNRRQQSEG